MGVSPNIISSSWRRTKIPRFKSLEVRIKSLIQNLKNVKDAVAADKEASLLHKLEMLEIEEEINKEVDDENVQIVQAEENVPPKAPESIKEKKFQLQITSFFAKKK